MKSKKCSTCGKPIKSDDKFCQHCGAAQKNVTPVTKPIKTAESKSISIASLLKWILIALFTGLVFGWIRYWIGYYILIQGIIAGLLIPWMIKKTAVNQMAALSNIRFKMAIALFFTFIISEAIGFGLAQPVFDPFNWFVRVWNGDTTESIFGIFSTAGVVSQTFSEGLSGGFWAFLWFIDLFFMFFFLLVSMPLSTKKVKS
ncbi:MAG TPA: zinc ribbon domain-containing protein [Draconibacterium sp.]|nr:zinc ribbon domain-containing protein [Draconibacterium sp.]